MTKLLYQQHVYRARPPRWERASRFGCFVAWAICTTLLGVRAFEVMR